MREMIKLFVVVVIFSAFSGSLLAALHNATEEKIKIQEDNFIRGPALKKAMEGASNDPLLDKFELQDGEEIKSFFVGVFDGKPNAVALEAFGKGYEDKIGVIVAINLERDEIIGIGVTTNKETPGVGKRIETDISFSAQFKGRSIMDPLNIRSDGGQIDAISGASFSSRGVCEALNATSGIYKRLKKEILKKAEAFRS